MRMEALGLCLAHSDHSANDCSSHRGPGHWHLCPVLSQAARLVFLSPCSLSISETLTVVLWTLSFLSAPPPSSSCPVTQTGFFFINILIFFWPCLTACEILVPQPGMDSEPPALEGWGLDYWTTREVPVPVSPLVAPHPSL